MKQIIGFTAAIATACALLFSCNKEINSIIPENEENQENPVVNEDVFCIRIELPETKTAFGAKEGDFYPKSWSIDDRIWVNGKVSDPLTNEQGAGTSVATFTFTENGEPDPAPYQVVYPSSAYSAGNINIPATQTFVSGNFDKAADIMLGYGETLESITMSNAVAYLKVQLTKGDYGNFGVKKIELSASGRKLNGSFAINATNHTALIVPGSTDTEAEQKITLDASAINPLLSDTPTEFLIAVAPQDLSGFTVTVTDTKDNSQTKTKSSNASLTAGKILRQSSFKFQEFKAIASPEDLIGFANACAGNTNYWLVTRNIDMRDAAWPVAGTSDAAGDAFNGVFDGGNEGSENGGFKISNLSSSTGAFINFAYSGSTIKNVTLDSSCSISFSGDITSSYKTMGLIGMSRGVVQNCYNRASVTCTSTNRSKNLYMGGIVGRLYRMGSITNCYNYGQVYSNVTLTYTKDTANEGGDYIGGIVGALERPNAGDEATINSCSNEGTIKASGSSSSSKTHIGGVVGHINSSSSSASLTVQGLVNTGDVIVENNDTRVNGVYVVAGGVIGGIHSGTDLSSASGSVEVKASHVTNCLVNNGDFNNETAYGSASHTGGFIGIARGGTIKFSENCYVSNVEVATRRGFGGGFVGYGRAATFDGCKVLSSSLKGSLAQLWTGGGIAGVAYGSTIKDCIVTLTKADDYNLFTSTTWLYSGGIVGKTQGTCSITGCKAYVKRMYQASDSPSVRGWILGYCEDGTTTINKCGLGGTYGQNADTYTLVDNSEDDYHYAKKIYGSAKEGATVTVGTGDNACEYWDGTLL